MIRHGRAPDMSDCDVAVIGAGPAGAAAAVAAARSGAQTWLIAPDRGRKVKACGGALTQQAMAWLKDKGLYPKTARPIVNLTVSPTPPGGTVAAEEPFFAVVERDGFDRRLTEWARQEPGVRFVAASVGGVEPTSGGVVITIRGHQIKARAAVGADGSAGVTWRWGFAPLRRDLGLAINLPPSAWLGDETAARFMFGDLPGSYAWIFPNAGGVNVGIIGDSTLGRQLRERLPSHLILIAVVCQRAEKPPALRPRGLYRERLPVKVHCV